MNRSVIEQQSRPSSLLPAAKGILQRKCACGKLNPGGGECIECRGKKNLNNIQSKLNISQLNDKYEEEAERTANNVVSMASNDRHVFSTHSFFQREKSDATQVPNASTSPAIKPIDTSTLAEKQVEAVSGGRPMLEMERSYFEPRFGMDFSQVQIYDNATADRAARSVGALAYTRGRDIVFKHGMYAPNTATGRHLLAHELTHVVQQGEASPLSSANILPKDIQRQNNPEDIQCLIDEDGMEAGPFQATSSEPINTSQMDEREIAQIGRQALDNLGYEEIIRQSIAAGILKPQSSNVEPNVQRTLDSGLLQRQGFAEVFTRYAVAAGVASQVDSPAPGPGDVVAVGILVVGLFAAVAAATSSTTARPCPPCPSPPSPEIDRVPPSRRHFPCPGDHWHFYVYNQNPVSCQCFGPRRMFGGCCGIGAPGAPC